MIKMKRNNPMCFHPKDYDRPVLSYLVLRDVVDLLDLIEKSR